MQTFETQVVVRELITEADHLSRQFHQAADDTLAGRLAALRSTLQRLDRALGGALSRSARSALTGEIDVVYQRIVDIAARSREADLRALLETAARLRPPPLALVTRFPIPGAPAPRAAVDAPAPLVDVDARDTERGSLERIATSNARAAVAPILLGIALGALLVPGIVPRLRRSAAGWGVAAGMALLALGIGLTVKMR